jgi:adenylylsulfate kinase
MINGVDGAVIWFTGLSGAGKSTLCQRIAVELIKMGRPVHVLDGDIVRQELCRDLSYTIEDRIENNRRISYVAGLLSKFGITVLVATISPLRIMRETAREAADSFIEVFVDAPLDVCEDRDPKGLYKQARSGKIQHFTGLHSVYEPPIAPNVTCYTAQETIDDSTAKILRAITTIGMPLRTCPDRSAEAVPGTSSMRRPTLAVDFDGVIAEYDGWKGVDAAGKPRQDVLESLRTLRDEGWKIIVHSTRSSEQLVPYLTDNCVPFDEVNQNSDYRTGSTKPVATVYWDDRALRYSGDARKDLALIRAFRTWSGRE